MIGMPDDVDVRSFARAVSDIPGTSRGRGGPLSGPTVLRIALGGALRRRREAAGVTREQAGWEIRASQAKLSRLELGRVGFKERDVADLLTLYGVHDPTERAEFLDLVRQAIRLAGGTATRICWTAGSRPTSGWNRPRQ